MEDLDREMAEVMGWKYIRYTGKYWVYQDEHDTFFLVPRDFHPSTDIAQAFQVVGKMIEGGWRLTICVYPDQEKTAEFWKAGFSYYKCHEQLATAICLAAKAAKKALEE